MSKSEIEQKVTLSRKEAARWLAELARAIDKGGIVEIALAGPSAALDFPDELQCELEIEPYGNKVELEIEFKWSTSGKKQKRRAQALAAQAH